jgi:hypothetical protein
MATPVTVFQGFVGRARRRLQMTDVSKLDLLPPNPKDRIGGKLYRNENGGVVRVPNKPRGLAELQQTKKFSSPSIFDSLATVRVDVTTTAHVVKERDIPVYVRDVERAKAGEKKVSARSPNK